MLWSLLVLSSLDMFIRRNWSVWWSMCNFKPMRWITTFVLCSQSPLHLHHSCLTRWSRQLSTISPSSQSERHLTVFCMDPSIVYFVNIKRGIYSSALFRDQQVNLPYKFLQSYVHLLHGWLKKMENTYLEIWNRFVFR